MTIKVINRGFIENKDCGDFVKLRNFAHKKCSLAYLANEVYNELTKTHKNEKFSISNLCDSLEKLSSAQYKALKKVLIHHFNQIGFKEKWSKNKVFHYTFYICEALNNVDELLPTYLIDEEVKNDFNDCQLNDFDLLALKFIAKCNPQFNFIIEQTRTLDQQTVISKYYLQDGNLKIVETKF